MRSKRVRPFTFQTKASMKIQIESETEYPFTAEQLTALTKPQRQAIEAVAEYLTGNTLTANQTDEEISDTFNLLKPCKGCVPIEEVGEDLLTTIRQKFGAVYQVGMELAEGELKQRNFTNFKFCLVVDPSYEDTTHVVILDYDKPICYLHEWTKAWHLSFRTLEDLANAVMAVKKSLVEKVTKSTEIFLIMDGGVIHEIVDLPDNINVTVLDYDTEGVEKERLEISPVDGELCVITKW
jgi:hypothetical protein